MPQACLFTVVEPPLNSEETLPTIEQAQDQLEVPIMCISSPIENDCTHEQGNEQCGEHVDKQSEEQSAEHVGEQNEGQPTEPPPLISEPIDYLKAGGGAESNLSNVLPLPLPEHYKKFSISDENDYPALLSNYFIY